VWSNTSFATGAPDGSYANTGAFGSGSVTQSLDVYNFAPSVPTNNVITGIEVLMTALRPLSFTRVINIDSCLLTIGGVTGTPTTTNASGTSLTTTAATYQFGSSTDLWGFGSSTLSLSNITSAVEGTGPTFSVWFLGDGGTSAGNPEVDAVQLTITYAATPTQTYLTSFGAMTISFQGNPLVPLL
jgi:hypothetical protein